MSGGCTQSGQNKAGCNTSAKNILLFNQTFGFWKQTDYLQALTPAQAQITTANYNETSHMHASLCQHTVHV